MDSPTKPKDTLTCPALRICRDIIATADNVACFTICCNVRNKSSNSLNVWDYNDPESLRDSLADKVTASASTSTAIVLDDFSVVVDLFGYTPALRFLIDVKTKVANSTLLVVAHEEVLAEQERQGLKHICDAFYTIGDGYSVEGFCKKMSGKIDSISGRLVLRNGKLKVQPSVADTTPEPAVPVVGQQTPSTTFELGVKKPSELSAKQSVELPFVNVQKQPGAGGRVIYLAEEEDDVDESDPDDDLDI